MNTFFQNITNRISKLKQYKNKYFIAGIFFLILQLMFLYKYIFLSNISNMLWFCSHAASILAIGFFFKKFDLIKGIISVGLIIQFFWFLDYFGKLFFDFYIFGVTDYMFLNTYFSYISSLFEHLTCSIALILTYKIKTKRKTLLYAFSYLLILLVVSLTFGDLNSNYNFVRNLIIFNEFTFTGYEIVWIIIAMTFIVLPVYFLQKWLYAKQSHKK